MEHQILGPTGELTPDVRHESPEIHALERLDLSSDELGFQLLPQLLLDGARNESSVRIDDLSPERETHTEGLKSP